MKSITCTITRNTLLFALMVTLLLPACNNNSEKSGTGIIIAPRDFTINAENAVNKAFLDSTAMEDFITDQNMSDTSADMLRSFYNSRNYQYAWIATNGLTEQGLSFKSLYDFGNDSGAAKKALDATLDQLTLSSTVEPANFLKAELMFSWRFVLYLSKVYNNAKESHAVITSFIPSKKLTVEARAALLLEQGEEGVKNKEYGKLKEKLKYYTKQVKDNPAALDTMRLLLINLERMRWAPDLGDVKSLQVNIPEFVLHSYKEGEDLNMPVVVGKEANSTIVFAGSLDQVVFSPYWNIPRSIVRKEILPGIEKNPSYLREHNMEITGEQNDLPVIRQLPGAGNSLGKVKFLFPNSFDIYLHDTPNKSLFNEEQRAFSHGCIRVSDPAKLAAFILTSMPEWAPEKIEKAMNSGQEQYVKVKNPVPVLITYYTVWVDAAGNLQVRDDIYKHDELAGRQLFTQL